MNDQSPGGIEALADVETFKPRSSPASPEPVLKLAEWLNRSLAEPDYLMGAWLTTTTRAMIVGPTGLGKTKFGVSLGMSVAEGIDFLHWPSRRKARVLYVDGEMSRRLLRQRLQDGAAEIGAKPAGFFALSTEDVEGMPPLNSIEGQRFIDQLIERHGPFDLIIFDNIQALLVGDMKEEEQWSKILPWSRSLTRRSTGQLWFHHTGHDEGKSYGSKAREWQMDCVALMERTNAETADLAFRLSFTKARERSPANRGDFEPVVMSLQGKAWSFNQSAGVRPSKQTTRALSPRQRLAMDALTEALIHGKLAPPALLLAGTVKVVETKGWRDELKSRGIIDADDPNPRKTFQRICEQLTARGLIAQRDGWVWKVSG